jgi:diaminopimelate epimerase
LAVSIIIGTAFFMTMMKLQFSKYQGAGNDFILIDNLSGALQLSSDQIQKLCDRNFGIGSDGLILLEASDSADYFVNFYNPDGSQSFCGNGSRCAFRMAQNIGLVTEECSFQGIDGLHHAKSLSENVSISMSDVASVDAYKDGFIVQTGSPHFVKFTDDLDKIDIIEEAHAIRYDTRYKDKGINVNFVLPESDGINMRTYERGVEAETLACGTGVTAAALVFALSRDHVEEVKVQTKGGNLSVNFERAGQGFNKIWLTGPAMHVYDGNIELL